MKEQHLRNKISVITFFCSLLVIWIHTFNLETYGINSNSEKLAQVVYYIENYWSNLTFIAVPMFFMISGFLFYRTYSMKMLLQKYKSRIKSILIPYLCWCTIYFLYFLVLTNVPVISRMMNSSDKVSLSFTTWFHWLWRDSYYTLWFLKKLMEYILLAPIIYVFLKDWKKNCPTGFCFLLFLCMCTFFEWYELPTGLVWYSLGSWIAINHKEWALYQNKKLSVVSAVYVLFILITAFQIWNVWLEIVFFIAIWFAMDLYNREVAIPWWMKITFFTYVAHDIFLEAYEKVILIIFGNKPMWALLDYIFTPVAVFVTLLVIASIFRRFLPKIWGILVGER